MRRSAGVRGGTSEDFIRESYAQLSFSEEELIRKGTGLLATMFQPSWRDLNGGFEEVTDVEHGILDDTMRSYPWVMIVVYDRRKRAPASEGDFLGIMSLGCVTQNIRLTAKTLGTVMQIMSASEPNTLRGNHARSCRLPITSGSPSRAVWGTRQPYLADACGFGARSSASHIEKMRSQISTTADFGVPAMA